MKVRINGGMELDAAEGGASSDGLSDLERWRLSAGEKASSGEGYVFPEMNLPKLNCKTTTQSDYKPTNRTIICSILPNT